MNFNFQVFTPEMRQSKSYPFISVNKSNNLGVSMPLARELKNKGWDYCVISYDNISGAIKIEKSSMDCSESAKINWGHVAVNLTPVMPYGRYAIFKRDRNAYYFSHQLM